MKSLVPVSATLSWRGKSCAVCNYEFLFFSRCCHELLQWFARLLVKVIARRYNCFLAEYIHSFSLCFIGRETRDFLGSFRVPAKKILVCFPHPSLAIFGAVSQENLNSCLVKKILVRSDLELIPPRDYGSGCCGCNGRNGASLFGQTYETLLEPRSIIEKTFSIPDFWMYASLHKL